MLDSLLNKPPRSSPTIRIPSVVSSSIASFPCQDNGPPPHTGTHLAEDDKHRPRFTAARRELAAVEPACRVEHRDRVAFDKHPNDPPRPKFTTDDDRILFVYYLNDPPRPKARPTTIAFVCCPMPGTTMAARRNARKAAFIRVQHHHHRPPTHLHGPENPSKRISRLQDWLQLCGNARPPDAAAAAATWHSSSEETVDEPTLCSLRKTPGGDSCAFVAIRASRRPMRKNTSSAKRARIARVPGCPC